MQACKRVRPIYIWIVPSEINTKNAVFVQTLLWQKNINQFKFCFSEQLSYFDHVCVDSKSIDSSTVKNLFFM